MDKIVRKYSCDPFNLLFQFEKPEPIFPQMFHFSIVISAIGRFLSLHHPVLKTEEWRGKVKKNQNEAIKIYSQFKSCIGSRCFN